MAKVGTGISETFCKAFCGEVTVWWVGMGQWTDTHIHTQNE